MSDTVIVSPDKLNEYRRQVQDMPEDIKAQALEAMKFIEACDGDLEAAANQMVEKFLLDSGAVERHGGNINAAMSEFLSGIEM